MILRALLVLSLLSIHGCSCASDGQASIVARLGQVAIEIPPGFASPHRSFPNERTELDVYVSNKDLAPTLIQLNRTVVPEARTGLSDTNRYEAAADFLVGFLRAFSKNVSDWSRSSVEPVRLGGQVAARAKWSGTFHGAPTTGVMYFVVLGKETYCIHVFGRADVPNIALKASIRAIEALRAETADISPERTPGR